MAVAAAGGHEPMAPVFYGTMLAVLIVLTVADTVLCTVNLHFYTETYAQYFNQGTGAVYILVSIPILLIRRRAAASKAVTGYHEVLAANAGSLQGGLLGAHPDAKPGPPLWILICIGALNGTGNFFYSIGSPHTRAETQVGQPAALSLAPLPPSSSSRRRRRPPPAACRRRRRRRR
eukprot:SAG22_NODE_3496_length_1681_cov_5.011378_1_plen_175_part_10